MKTIPQEISFAKCEKCGSGDLATETFLDKNIFQIKCKKCGSIIFEGPLFVEGDQFVEDAKEEVKLLTPEEIKKLDTKELFSSYYLGEIDDGSFMDETITRLINLERVIKLLKTGLNIEIKKDEYAACGSRMITSHEGLLKDLGWSHSDYRLVNRTLKKIK